MLKERGEGMEVIKIVTSNRDKFLEAEAVLKREGIRCVQVDLKLTEIQSDVLDDIAETRLRDALKMLKPPVATEDAGLFIEALNGFPGPFSSYVHRTIGCEGIIKLMEGRTSRYAEFISVVAYADREGKTHRFVGKLRGEIAMKPSGVGGFGFDPIFIPSEMPGRTLADLGFEEKNRISHRAKSFSKLALHIKQSKNKFK